MKNIVLALFVLLAANPAFADQSFTRLVAKVVETGEHFELPVGQMRFLSHIAPDEGVPHTADYFTVTGSAFGSQFEIGEVGAVSEIWSIDENHNWNINQWNFKADPTTGELTFLYHQEIVETMDGSVLSTRELPTKSVKDPESLETWNRILTRWYDWTGTAPRSMDPQTDALLTKLIASGQRMELQEGELRYFGRVVPDNLKLPRKADYLNVLGMTLDGTFYPMEMGGVSEVWGFDGKGNWQIDQWTLKVNFKTDELTFISHQVITETLAGRILDVRAMPTKDIKDPESVGLWKSMKDNWSGWLKR